MAAPAPVGARFPMITATTSQVMAVPPMPGSAEPGTEFVDLFDGQSIPQGGRECLTWLDVPPDQVLRGSARTSAPPATRSTAPMSWSQPAAGHRYSRYHGVQENGLRRGAGLGGNGLSADGFSRRYP